MKHSFSFEPVVVLTTAWPHQISGQVLSSHSIVSSSRTVRPCSQWGGRWIGHWRTHGRRLFFCATLTGRRRGHTPFAQARAETSDTDAEAVEPDPHCSWEDHSGSECHCGDENMEFLWGWLLTPHSIGDPPHCQMGVKWSRCPDFMAWYIWLASTSREIIGNLLNFNNEKITKLFQVILIVCYHFLHFFFLGFSTTIFW